MASILIYCFLLRRLLTFWEMKLILFETNKLGTVSSLFIEVEEGESGREEEGDEGGNGGISRV